MVRYSVSVDGFAPSLDVEVYWLETAVSGCMAYLSSAIELGGGALAFSNLQAKVVLEYDSTFEMFMGTAKNARKWVMEE